MKCETFVSLIDDFVDAALPTAERQRMEEHLRVCRKCREDCGHWNPCWTGQPQ
jgi:anti-sigma factor RsiW